MKLYCTQCSLFVCGECIDESHCNHETISVMKYVEMVKEEWMNNVERVKEEHPALSSFLSSEISLKTQIQDVEKEIDKLEEEMKRMKEKKISLENQLNDLLQSKVNIDLSSRFLSSFLLSLPPLPLSSFSSSSYPNHYNNNDIVMKRRR